MMVCYRRQGLDRPELGPNSSSSAARKSVLVLRRMELSKLERRRLADKKVLCRGPNSSLAAGKLAQVLRRLVPEQHKKGPYKPGPEQRNSFDNSHQD